MATYNISSMPIMQQYAAIKQAHQDCLLLFRVGDFYELHYEDAVYASKLLNIRLTAKRTSKDDTAGIPLCGFPAFGAEPYIHQLIKADNKVAVCEQLETPEQAKKQGRKLVKREVVQIITPGTIVDGGLLDSKQNNYLCSVALVDGITSMAWVELSTGEFKICITHTNSIATDLARLTPNEVLIPEKIQQGQYFPDLLADYKEKITVRADSIFDFKRAETRLKEFFRIPALDILGSLTKSDVTAAGALLEYLEHTQKGLLFRLNRPKKININYYMAIEPHTKRNLEITKNVVGGKKGTLLATIDKTLTAAGGRLLHNYLSSPLTDAGSINRRLDMVGFFVKNLDLRKKIQEILQVLPDMERSLSRLFTGRGSPRDLLVIKDGAIAVLKISELLTFAQIELPSGLVILNNSIGAFDELLYLLKSALNIEVPVNAKDGGFIRSGYDVKLDELRDLQKNSEGNIEALRDKYRAATGINNLKIERNNVLGYFIEVGASHSAKMTGNAFVHRQNIGNTVRYTTDELKNLEAAIYNSKEQALQIELNVFDQLVAAAMEDAENIALSGHATAVIDVMVGLAQLAEESGYTRPIVDNSLEFKIEGGRHPVVAASLGNEFIANDSDFSEGQRFWLITGPNMAGKSTFLRQNALICILSQIGSFVPAKYAHIGAVDKLFSRIGAADDIASGQSTFMVEMVETSVILNNASKRSFVILDEIGRGTSTYDGIAIAWAVVEHMHNIIGCRALFATHYHELTVLEKTLASLKCCTLKVQEWEGRVIFLYLMIAGVASSSFGINVAELAGLPYQIIERAKQVLLGFKGDKVDIPTVVSANNDNMGIAKLLQAIDIDALTPREAFDIIYKMKSDIEV